MRAVLQAAYRNGMIQSRGPPGFWVTEFSWDTAPPDPHGLLLRLHARWTAEALYRMWSAGVSLVTWLTLRDQPLGVSSQYIQGGFYFRGQTIQQDRAKPAARAFRFPFVAYKQTKGLRFWGRTPTSTDARVAIEQKAGGRGAACGPAPVTGTGSFATTSPLAPEAARSERGSFRAVKPPSRSR
jgi:hypothetical protein